MSSTIIIYDKSSPSDAALISEVSALVGTIVPATTVKSFSRELLRTGLLVFKAKQSLSGQKKCYFESLLKSIKNKTYRVSKDGKSLTFPID